MKRMTPLTGLGALLTTAPLWMGASDCEVAIVQDGCKYEGQHYDVGESFPDADGCNTCSCTDDGEVACTLIACADVCEYGGTTYMIGASFPATDGCNECTCTEGGAVACTEKACGSMGCDYGGQHYEPGDSFPDTDGCNTCMCAEDGSVGCTLKECAGCEYNGQHYAVGDSFPAADGCNSCGCGMDGQVSCTATVCDGCTFGSTQFQPGDSVVCPDGCNHCGCDMNGWNMTDAACAPLPTITQCDATEPSGGEVDVLYLHGNALAVNITYSGGCEEHTFKLCWDGAFLESNPVQARLKVVDTSPVADPCEALPTESRVFDLSPLQDSFRSNYPMAEGVIILGFGDGESTTYQF